MTLLQAQLAKKSKPSPVAISADKSKVTNCATRKLNSTRTISNDKRAGAILASSSAARVDSKSNIPNNDAISNNKSGYNGGSSGRNSGRNNHPRRYNSGYGGRNSFRGGRGCGCYHNIYHPNRGFGNCGYSSSSYRWSNCDQRETRLIELSRNKVKDDSSKTPAKDTPTLFFKCF